MANLLRRLDALEADASPEVTLRSSTKDLCRYLALMPLEELRREIDIADVDFTATLEEIRFHVPGYGVETTA